MQLAELLQLLDRVGCGLCRSGLPGSRLRLGLRLLGILLRPLLLLAAVDSAGHGRCGSGDYGCAGYSSYETWHFFLLFVSVIRILVGASGARGAYAASSSSRAAMIAWTGIRPLATSWPPERRTAEANGAAQAFS